MALREDIERSVAQAMNHNCAENGSNTPDFILAEFLVDCLLAFDKATTRREDWYGHRHAPGGLLDREGPCRVEDHATPKATVEPGVPFKLEA